MTTLFLLALSILLIALVLAKAQSQFGANQKLGHMQAQSEVLPLPNWSVSAFNCLDISSVTPRCVHLNSIDTVILPNVAALTSLLSNARNLQSTQTEGQLALSFRHQFTPSEKQWMLTHQIVHFQIPKSVQHKMTVYFGNSVSVHSNIGATVGHRLAIQNQAPESIHIWHEPGSLPYVGPSTFPILLTQDHAVAWVQALATSQDFMGFLGQLFMILVPLTIVAASGVIDTNASLRALAFFAMALALRSFLPFSASLEFVQNGGAYLYCLLCTLSTYTLGRWVLHSASAQANNAWAVFATLLGLTLIYFQSSNFQFYLVADLWSDGISAFIGLILFFRHMNQTDIPLKIQIKNPKNIFLTASLLCLLIANAIDTLAIHSGVAKLAISLPQALFMPFAFLSSLVETGTFARFQITIEQQLRQKALLDSDLKIAQALQLNFIAKHKVTAKHWRSRILYRPASVLSGDWLDICEVHSGGETYVLLAIVDITGHGAGSALATAVLASLWRTQCSVLKQSQVNIGQWLSEIPWHLGIGLESAHQNFSATGQFIAIRLYDKQGWIVSAAHPHALITNNHSVKEIIATGPHIGSQNIKWQPVSFCLQPGQSLFLYTDGLFDTETNRTRWLSGLNRKTVQGTLNFRAEIFSVIKKTQSHYRNNHVDKDDMSAAILHFS